MIDIFGSQKRDGNQSFDSSTEKTHPQFETKETCPKKLEKRLSEDLFSHAGMNPKTHYF